MQNAQGLGFVTLVRYKFLSLYHPTERFPKTFILDNYGKKFAISRFVSIGWDAHRVLVAKPTWIDAALQSFPHAGAKCRQHGILQANVDISTRTTRLNFIKSGQNKVGRIDSRDYVGKRCANHEWFAICGADDAHDPGDRLNNRIECKTAPVRPFLTKTRDRAVDELRVCRREVLPSDTQSIDRAGSEILDNHIRAGHKRMCDLTIVIILEVQANTLFRTVISVEIVLVTLTSFVTPHGAEIVAAVRAFNLQYLCAEIGKNSRTMGARYNLRKVENPDP